MVFIILILALQGCAQLNAGERPGIYIVASNSDAPGWIGEPIGPPIWSPDGSEIAWGTEIGVTVASLNNGQTRLLTSGRIAGRPAWSPAEDAIAFVDEGSALLSVVSSKSGATLLEVPISSVPKRPKPSDLVTFGGPAWSPDGSRLAYACWDGAGDELCVIDKDGGGNRTVTKLEPPSSTSGVAGATAGSNVGPPAWSPDGSAVAVAAYPERRGATAGVFVIDLKQGAARRISKLLPNSEIRWTPDGASLIFSASEKGRSDVWRISTKTLQSAKLTGNLPKGARSPALSPDGKEIAVASDGAVMVLAEGGSTRRIDAPGLKGADPSWNPSGNEIAFAALPDPIRSYD